MEEKPKARRFAVEPVEHTVKHSKDAQTSSPDKSDGTTKVRHFTPQVVDESTKSSKDKQSTKNSEEKPMARHFAPQVVEESYKSSKDKPAEVGKAAHVKFAPQPVETIHRTNRRPKEDAEPQQKTPRKFAPILLDTAKRSRRAGDATPALSQADKTETGFLIHARENRRHITGDRTPVCEADIHMPDAGEVSPTTLSSALKRDIDGGLRPRPRPVSMNSQRSHSFRCPDLETIESSESEQNSNMSSLSNSPGAGSPITGSDSSFNDVYKHATRVRESVDENFTHYLLQLEAKKAQQRMQDQALAAFPNLEKWDNVPHFVNAEEDSDDMEVEERPVTFDFEEELLQEMAARRESTVKIHWEQLELQRHAEKMEQERNAANTTAKPQTPSPWWNPGASHAFPQPDNELRSMRDRARPPMLGMDLVFPRTRSPEPARFDVTQGSTMLRSQMCYLTEHVEAQSKGSEDECGLWNASRFDSKPFVSVRSPGEGSNKGLWGGFCVADGKEESVGGLAPPSGPTGLMTPRVEVDENPFEQSFVGKAVPVGIPPGASGLKTPPTPPSSLRGADLGCIDAVLSAEQQLDSAIEAEYPDSFITQVYNYLALGYPSLARPFDEELSKISLFSMAELRQHDKKARKTPRGYIRLGPDFEGGGGEGLTEDSCMRWQALKRYIREWARQETSFSRVDGPGGNWGTGARRGSWAI